MPAKVSPGNYASSTHSHRARLFRFSHGRRFTLALDLLEPGPHDRVLDFGSGDGHLLDLIAARHPEAQLVAFEPLDFLRDELRARLRHREVAVAARFEELPAGTYDRIACLEVFEHLPEPILQQAIERLRTLLAPNGVLVVTVPIEIGLPGFLKYAAARMITRSNRHLSFGEALGLIAGRAPSRDTGTDFLSHRGFDHRPLKRALLEAFRLERERYSPVPLLGGWANAQVMWRLRSRAASTPQPITRP
jgi:SAM-dependent methyltransferase